MILFNNKTEYEYFVAAVVNTKNDPLILLIKTKGVKYLMQFQQTNK